MRGRGEGEGVRGREEKGVKKRGERGGGRGREVNGWERRDAKKARDRGRRWKVCQ